MDVLELISEMERLLAEERDAIVRLDGARVATLAEQKLRLARALEATSAPERVAAAGRMRKLVRGLKTNGALLAQARGILAEFLRGVPATLRGGTGPSGRSIAPSARHLSVRA